MSETATERLSRLLALVPWLRANDGITIADAAQHFGVSEEQLSTDLWQIIVCGIPGYGPDQLIDIQFWDDDRIHVLNPVALEQAMHLTPEEITALHLGLRVLAQVPGEHDQRALVSAMVKLEAATQTEMPVDIQMSERPDIVALVGEAIRTGADLEIDYASGDEDRVETRRLHADRFGDPAQRH
jgi:proteasome accessory factor C